MGNWRWRSLHWHMRRPASPGDSESSSQVQRCGDRIEKLARPSPFLGERGTRKKLCAIKAEAPWPVGNGRGKELANMKCVVCEREVARFFELAQDFAVWRRTQSMKLYRPSARRPK
jgi:hypothetical protein